MKNLCTSSKILFKKYRKQVCQWERNNMHKDMQIYNMEKVSNTEYLRTPANSHALCVSFMPVDQRHWSHASRTISHTWLTNPEGLFFLKHINNKNSIQFPQKYSKKRRFMPSLSPEQQAIKIAPRFRALYCDIRQPSEVVGISSVMFRSRRNISECSEVVGTFSEIRVIWIRKSHAFDLGKVGRYTKELFFPLLTTFPQQFLQRSSYLINE